MFKYISSLILATLLRRGIECTNVKISKRLSKLAICNFLVSVCDVNLMEKRGLILANQ